MVPELCPFKCSYVHITFVFQSPSTVVKLSQLLLLYMGILKNIYASHNGVRSGKKFKSCVYLIEILINQY